MPRDNSASGQHSQESVDLQSLLGSLDHAPDVIFVTDAAGRVLFINRAVAGLTGISAEDLTGQPFVVLVRASDHGSAEDALENTRRDERRRPQVVEMAWRSADPRKALFVEVALHCTEFADGTRGCVGVARDMSRREETLDRRLTTERVAAIVELAVATAHKINNPLAILAMHLGTLRKAAERGEQVPLEVFDQMSAVVGRIAEVTRDLAAMADASVQKTMAGRAMVDLRGWSEVGKGAPEEKT